MNGITPERFAALSPRMQRSFRADWEEHDEMCVLLYLAAVLRGEDGEAERARYILCEHGDPRAWCDTCERRKIKRRAARAHRILRSYARR